MMVGLSATASESLGIDWANDECVQQLNASGVFPGFG